MTRCERGGSREVYTAPVRIAVRRGAFGQNCSYSPAAASRASAYLHRPSTAQWAQTTKFTDPALVKAAIAEICKTARALNLKSVDEARALSYDQGMQKAGVVLAGVKSVLGVYGLNVDKALDSIKVQAAPAVGDTAKVTVSYTAFDKPFTTEAEMVKVDGRWYGKNAIEQWKKRQAEAAVAAAKPAQSAEPPVDSGK